MTSQEVTSSNATSDTCKEDDGEGDLSLEGRDGNLREHGLEVPDLRLIKKSSPSMIWETLKCLLSGF